MKKLGQEIKFWKKIVIISFGLFICSLIGLIIINYSDIFLEEKKESPGVVDELTGKKLLCLQPLNHDTVTDFIYFNQNFLVTGFKFLTDKKINFINGSNGLKYDGYYNKDLKYVYITIPEIYFETKKKNIFFEEKKKIGLFVRLNRQNLEYNYSKLSDYKSYGSTYFRSTTNQCQIFSGDLFMKVIKTSNQVDKEIDKRIEKRRQNEMERKIKKQIELESKQKI